MHNDSSRVAPTPLFAILALAVLCALDWAGRLAILLAKGLLDLALGNVRCALDALLGLDRVRGVRGDGGNQGKVSALRRASGAYSPRVAYRHTRVAAPFIFADALDLPSSSAWRVLQ